MRRDAKRATVAIIVALVAACSSPATTESGFISLGRDTGNGDNGGVGAVGSGFGAVGPGTGGVFTTGGIDGSSGTAIATGGDGGTAGTVPSQGGTTGASGGTTGVNGGTTTGGEGPSCGSGGMLTAESERAVVDVCGSTGPNSRVCLPDDSVWYCGEHTGGVLEQCPPGTCATGCCHATSDPCPVQGVGVSDCAGDCGVGFCDQAPILNLSLVEDDYHVVRVGGSNTVELSCGAKTRRYFEIMLEGGPARVTVSPPWRVSESISCDDAEYSQCVLSDFGLGWVVVSTDADTPPPRNVVLETSSLGSSCP